MDPITKLCRLELGSQMSREPTGEVLVWACKTIVLRQWLGILLKGCRAEMPMVVVAESTVMIIRRPWE